MVIFTGRHFVREKFFMPSDPVGRKAAEEWLRYARGNLARATQDKPAEAPWDYMCFDAQQAAEKAIKAILVLRSIEFPRTHELGELLALLHQAGEQIPEDVWRAQELSGYATHARYPGGEQPATEEDYKEALTISEKIVTWAAGIIYAS